MHRDGESAVFRPGLLVPRCMCEALRIAEVCGAPSSGDHWSGNLSNLMVVPLLRHELAAAIKETVSLNTFKRCYTTLLGGTWPYGNSEGQPKELESILKVRGPVERARTNEEDTEGGYEVWTLREQNKALKKENEALKAAPLLVVAIM